MAAEQCGKFAIPDKFDEHPGGEVLLQLGRDSKHPDILFLSYHIGLDIDGKIAAIAKKRNIETPTRGEVFQDVHNAILQVKKDHAIHHWVYVAWCLFTTIALPVVFSWFILSPNFILSLLSAFLWVTYSFNIFHMRNHKGGHLYGIKALDDTLNPLYDFLEKTWAIRPQAWIDNHNGSHHVYTNSNEDDHDVWTPYPFLRLHPKQKFHWAHSFQKYYAPILFLATTASYPFDNVFKNGGGYFPFFVWIYASFGIPAFSGWTGPLYVVAMYCVSGIIMSYLFQVSHNHCNLGPRNEKITDIDHWLKMQVEESMSWGGYLSCLFFGGINFQIEHHIAPALDSTFYYFLHPKLVEICKKHKITYTYEPTAFDAVYQYHKWLSVMGEDKQE